MINVYVIEGMTKCQRRSVSRETAPRKESCSCAKDVEFARWVKKAEKQLDDFQCVLSNNGLQVVTLEEYQTDISTVLETLQSGVHRLRQRKESGQSVRKPFVSVVRKHAKVERKAEVVREKALRLRRHIEQELRLLEHIDDTLLTSKKEENSPPVCGTICTVCCEMSATNEKEKWITLKCKHSFHRKCWEQNVMIGRSTRCPTCRDQPDSA